MYGDPIRLLVGRCADSRGERTDVAVTVADGKIVALEPIAGLKPSAGDVDARDALLLPGFIDIHVHGGAGRYLMDGSDESVDIVAAHLASHGVTGFLPTTVTASWDDTRAMIAAAEDHVNCGSSGHRGAAVLGVHLEGPYINPKRRGAQPEESIRLPDWDEFASNVEVGRGGIVRIVTIAPEMPGATDMIRRLALRGIVASIGHTDATYDQVSAAIDAGARHVTHCFNAMRPMESREPGTVGAAFSRPELTAELIWDNIHVHAASCRALIAAKGADGVILISDGIPGAGMMDGYEFALGSHTAIVRNGAARLADGTLAGSLLTLERAFSNATPFPLAARAAMTSRNAAIALGLGASKGLIAPGYDADLVLLNADATVRSTYVNGWKIYAADER